MTRRDRGSRAYQARLLRMPCARSRSRTIGLCTNSPRMVSELFSGELLRLGDGVAHAETHSKMVSQKNLHIDYFLQFTLCHKVIVQKFFYFVISISSQFVPARRCALEKPLALSLLTRSSCAVGPAFPWSRRSVRVCAACAYVSPDCRRSSAIRPSTPETTNWGAKLAMP